MLQRRRRPIDRANSDQGTINTPFDRSHLTDMANTFSCQFDDTTSIS
jgi:hypothetical protein